MPSSMIHLNIAYSIGKKAGIKQDDMPSLILGSVSPDAVNTGVIQAPKEIRYSAHLRDRDLKIWENNVFEYAKNCNISDKAFLLGFVIHILTDIKWDELVQPSMLDKVKTKNPDKDPKSIKWVTLIAFDNLLLQKENRGEILDLLKLSDPEKEISTVTKEMLISYKNELCERYENQKAQGDTNTVLSVCDLELVENSVTELLIQQGYM